MKKVKRSVVLLMLGAVLSSSLSSCDVGGNKDDYGIPVDAIGPELLGLLHDRMMNTHTTYIKYTAVNNYLGKTPSTDEDPEKSDKNILFYTGKRVSKTTSSTREHVWACANSSGLWTHTSTDGQYYVDGSNYVGGGSDLYHIRPCGYNMNTVRGNGKFMEFPETAVKGTDYWEVGETNGLYTMKVNCKMTAVNVDTITLNSTTSGLDYNVGYATKVEPADEYKGDIARILMYVYVHYSSKLGTNEGIDATKKSYLGDLKLNQVFNSSYSYQEIYKLLVKWNNLDPVDEHEKKRNDTIEAIQGNRNPFVDHPEYMARCWGIEEE